MKKNFLKQQNNKTDHVEFGMEFGDLNASKLYEIPFMNQEKSKKKKT